MVVQTRCNRRCFCPYRCTRAPNCGGHVPVDMTPTPVHLCAGAPKDTTSTWTPVVAKRRVRRTQDEYLSTQKLDEAKDCTIHCHDICETDVMKTRPFDRVREGIARGPVRTEVHERTNKPIFTTMSLLMTPHELAPNQGGRTAGSQTPGVPATHEPSTTHSCESSRAPKNSSVQIS